MLTSKVYENRKQFSRRFDPRAYPKRELETLALMVDPEHFRLDEVLNPHSLDAEGRMLEVDTALAIEQWSRLVDTMRSSGIDVEILPGRSNLPDMVFAANEGFPYVSDSGERRVVLSKMTAPSRRPEVAHFESWFRSKGFAVDTAPCGAGESFEGCGDLLWLSDRKVILGGWGFRTSRVVLDRLAARIDVPIIAFHLTDPAFYHLDTAVTVLDDSRCLAHRPAFTEEGWDLLHAVFEEVVTAPADEARHALVCHAFAPRPGVVIVEEEARLTCGLLEEKGYEVHPVPTSEFRKSGGSIFCLKLMIP